MDGGGKRARKHDEGMDDVFGDKDAMIALSRVAQKLVRVLFFVAFLFFHRVK